MKNFRDRENDQFCSAVMVHEINSQRELSDDFILPDYLPDVKKVVWVQACPRLGNRFLGSGILEFEGAVAYKVLYIAEDNKVRCAVFLSEFKNKIESEELGEDCVDVLLPVSKSVICRMQNPRKLNIRCKAGIEGAIWRRVSFLPELYGARSGEEKSIETKEGCFDALNVTSRRESGLVYSEDITLESSMPAIGEIICSSADIYVDECRPTGNELLLRGVCEVELLYSVTAEEKEDYILLRRTLPYSQSLEADTLKEGCSCRVQVLPEGVTVNVREDEFGKRRMVELDINYSLDMEVIHPKKLYYCMDCYSVDRECQSTFDTKRIWRLEDVCRSSFSVNENRLQKELDASELVEVKACSVSPYLVLENERGKKDRPIYTGMAKVTVLGAKEDGTHCTTVFDVPLRLETEKALSTQQVKALVDCRAAGVRCRSDGEKLYVDFEVICSMTLMAYEDADCVQVIRMLPDKSRDQEKGAVVIIFCMKLKNIWQLMEEVCGM